MTRSELASRAGVVDTYIKDIESGAHSRFGPGVFGLLDIALALGCTVDELLGRPAPSLDGLAVVDDSKVRIVTKARKKADLEPLRFRGRYWIGAHLDNSCRIVRGDELDEIHRRFADKIEQLEADAEDEGRRGDRR